MLGQRLRERPRVVIAALVAAAVVFAASMLLGAAMAGDSGQAAPVPPADVDAEALREQVEAAEARITELEAERDGAHERAKRQAERAQRLGRRVAQLERARGRRPGGSRGTGR